MKLGFQPKDYRGEGWLPALLDSGHTHSKNIYKKCMQVSDSSQNVTMQMRRGGAGAGSANQEAAGRQCRPIRGQDGVGTMRTSAPTLSTYLVVYLYFILAQACATSCSKFGNTATRKNISGKG